MTDIQKRLLVVVVIFSVIIFIPHYIGELIINDSSIPIFVNWFLGIFITFFGCGLSLMVIGMIFHNIRKIYSWIIGGDYVDEWDDFVCAAFEYVIDFFDKI